MERNADISGTKRRQPYNLLSPLMKSVSTPTLLAFLITIFLVASLVGGRLWRGGERRWIFRIFLAYLVVPGALAWRGFLDRYDPPPAPVLLLMVGLTILTTTICLTRSGERISAETSWAWLIGLQSFRIPVELILHRLYQEGVVPIQMTFEGRNFDIAVGISGLMLGVLCGRGWHIPNWILWVWNLGGLLLLFNVVGIAVLSTPTAFRWFEAGPPNLLPSTFPFVWLPSFLVQAALAGHLLVARKLRQRRDRSCGYD
jgi:hypothetical protein